MQDSFEQQIQFLRDNWPFGDGVNCAAAFYQHFEFANRGAATDALRKSLLHLKNDPVFDSIRGDVKSDTFKKWEADYLNGRLYSQKVEVERFASRQEKRLEMSSLHRGADVLEGSIDRLSSNTTRAHRVANLGQGSKTDASEHATLSAPSNPIPVSKTLRPVSKHAASSAPSNQIPLSNTVRPVSKRRRPLTKSLHAVSNILLQQTSNAPVLTPRTRSVTSSAESQQKGSSKKQAGKQNMVDDHQCERTMSSRKQRYLTLDKSKFWRLESGRDVETVLHEASLDGPVTFRMRSYTIDYDCSLTRELFTDDEWQELCEERGFELPGLSKTIEKYLYSLHKALNEGVHPATVPIPEDDAISCELALLSIIQWTQLYKANPSPFDISDTSESYWCREGWPLLRRILGNVDGITMIDGEKTTYESKNRRNKDRRLDIEGKGSRKQKGKNVDMVGRDTRNQKDWFIVESMAVWDVHSTKFLHETSVILFKELHMIASSRTLEVQSDNFVENARFFAVYSGGPGFQTHQLRPSTKSPYIFLHLTHACHILPSAPNSWNRQIKGIAHLLRVRMEVKRTIELYQRCLEEELDEYDYFAGESDMDDVSWIYEDPQNLGGDPTLGSSPLAYLL